MELWKWELRKIWRPGILAAILLLGAVYYWMFPQFYIEYFCNGPSGEAQFDLASDWVARYGPTLEPEERAQLDGQAEEIGSFDQQISSIPEASAAGLTDYESFLSFREEYLNGVLNADGQADMDTEYLLNRVYGGTSWYTIAVLEQAMEAYEREYLSAVVSSCGGDLRRAAGKMGLHLSTLYRKLEKLGLKPPRSAGHGRAADGEPTG